MKTHSTIEEALGEHVCKVDAFSEHVSRNRRFWRRDSESLSEDSSKVHLSRAVPQQHPVANVRFEFCRLAVTVQLEDLKKSGIADKNSNGNNVS